jgi:hypothetical protein
VYTGTLHLLVNAAVLIQVGAVLERLVGRVAFAAVYVSAGVFAGLVFLSSYPLAVNAGASGAIFGLYGLLFASAIWQRFERRPDDLQPESDFQPEADESAHPGRRSADDDDQDRDGRRRSSPAARAGSYSPRNYGAAVGAIRGSFLVAASARRRRRRIVWPPR